MYAICNKLLLPLLKTAPSGTNLYRNCHNVYGIKDLMQRDKLDNIRVKLIEQEDYDTALEMIKQLYLPEHVLVKSRGIDMKDRALDEYVVSMMKQGNSLFAVTDTGIITGISINCASSPIDLDNLRNFAYYRQEPTTKDFLYFTASLLETPNLWQVFKEPKIFEIKMLAVVPEFRRQGLAVFLADKSMGAAHDQGYKVVRMDCMNPYDYKIAERISLECLTKFPLHKLRSSTAAYIQRTSEFNRFVRIYVDFRDQVDVDGDKYRTLIREKKTELEKLME